VNCSHIRRRSLTWYSDTFIRCSCIKKNCSHPDDHKSCEWECLLVIESLC
jgi:hypothetical protein